MSLRSINRVLHAIGWCLFIVILDDDDDAARRGRTHFTMEWIGLPWSRRRRAWNDRWTVETPHFPHLHP